MANIMRLGGGSGGGKQKKLLSSLTEGSLVSVLEDGKLVPFYVAKHNYEADLNGEGRTLLVRKDAYAAMSWHTNSNSNEYSTSNVDSWLNNTYVNKLSVVLRNHLVPTSIDYVPGGGGNNVLTLARALFILSLTELGLSDSSVPTTGTALPTASQLKIVYKNGAAVSQWTRNPFTLSNVYYAIAVNASGGVESPRVTSNTPYVRPCFTLPDTMELIEAPYIDGSWGLADEYEPTATVDITENGIHNVKAYSFANVNVQSAPVLLWTNASPNSQFAPQTVSVNGADYNAYLIEIKWAYSGGYTGIGYVPIGGTKCTIATHNNGSGALDSSALRAVESASKSGITFGNGANGAARVEGYNYGVPLRIWGLKFTL